ncbi:MAG TPA: cation:dicarboxylase symporter family transporter [Parafilimonas sp.]|nr:cation:dicarboxylase symporter family transporter [Parafilimonas sp.]
MKNIFTNLTFWVLIAITAGILIGNFAPEIARYPVLQKSFKSNILGQDVKLGTTLSEFLGDVFINLVKQLITPIIFLTITLGISNMGDLKRTGRVGAKAILYFEIMTTFALLIGIVVAHLIQPGASVNASKIQTTDISTYTKMAKEFSWWEFLKDNITIQIVILAIIAGIILNSIKHKQKIIDVLNRLSKYVFIILKYVMYLAPLGAFGGMAFTVSKFGLNALLPLGKLMLSVYTTCLIFIFLVLGLMLRYYKLSIFKFLNYIKEELLIVLGTSSSEAGLPALIEKLERAGCSQQVTGLVVPAGYSFNLDGTTIYLSMGVMFLAQVYNVHLSAQQIITIIGVLMITSKGAAGVTGSGFAVLASTLTAVKVIPVEGLALLIGVDRFMSEARALTNFIGNGVATLWLSNNEKEFDRNKMRKEFKLSQ